MKVLLINGSLHEHGCTDAALSLVADALRENGVEAETYWLGVKPVTGCIGCRQCMKLGGKCAIDDKVNEFKELARAADGFCVRLTRALRLLLGQPQGLHGPAFLLRAPRQRLGGLPSQARGGSGLRPQERHHGGSRPDQPLLHHVRDARHPLALLVRRTRRQARGRVSGRGGRFVMRTLGRYMAYYLRCLEAGRGGRNNSARAGEL